MDEPTENTFAAILLDDLAQAMRRNSQEQSQSSRREVVRTAFAAIEGVGWMFRDHILEAAKPLGVLSAEEDLILSEKTHHVSSEGKISTQSRFIPFLTMIRLIARISARLSLGNQIDFSGSDWATCKAALAIRHRITHPKSAQDLQLSEKDTAICVHAFFWLLEQTTLAMERANLALKSHLGDLAKLLTELRQDDPAAWHAYNAASAALRAADE